MTMIKYPNNSESVSRDHVDVKILFWAVGVRRWYGEGREREYSRSRANHKSAPKNTSNIPKMLP